MITILNNINELLKERHISKTELSLLTGIKAPNLSRILSGGNDIRLSTLTKIATALGVNMADIINKKPKEDSYIMPKTLKPEINGYLEFNDENVSKIASISDVKKWLKINENRVKALQTGYSDIIEKYEVNKGNKRKVYNLNIKSIFEPNKSEIIDATKVKIWSFFKAEDEKEYNGQIIENKLGNMVNNFPFKMNGIQMPSSEVAYILGRFSNNNLECKTAQKVLLGARNGMEAKKLIQNEYKKIIREDFDDFKVAWMFYCVWQKVLNNNDFKALLLSIPNNCLILENASTQNGQTADFWGSKSEEIRNVYGIIEGYVNIAFPNKTKAEKDRIIMLERNKYINNNYGLFKGANVMGKILTVCKKCLETNTLPPIDYNLLKKKKIYIMGKLMQF